MYINRIFSPITPVCSRKDSIEQKIKVFKIKPDEWLAISCSFIQVKINLPVSKTPEFHSLHRPTHRRAPVGSVLFRCDHQSFLKTASKLLDCTRPCCCRQTCSSAHQRISLKKGSASEKIHSITGYLKF